MPLDRLLSRLHLLVGTVTTRSALNPLLWLSATVTTVCVVGAVAAEGPIRYILLVLAALPVVAAVASYAYFAVKDRKRLQSEQ